jgi:hypothetical protein
MVYRTNRRTRGIFRVGSHPIPSTVTPPGGLPDTEVLWRPVLTTFGESGYRWMIRDSSGQPQEEITIEDPSEESEEYEVVTHDFRSGDIDTEAYTKTLEGARRAVAKLLKNFPQGTYEA